jgi:predicted RNA-binding protein with RPS1 domain
MILTLFLSLGIPLGLAIYLLIQIIKDPNKIDKYKAIVLTPFYKFGKWSARSYLAAKIGSQVTELFNRHVVKNIANQSDIKIGIKWIISTEDPVFKENNSVIICIKKDKDQTKNILKASEAAIPIITYRNLRSSIEDHLEQAIDLVTLRNLANRLGRHGSFAFSKYFFEPQIKDDDRIANYFHKLVEVDNRGFFVPIFLNELEFVGNTLYIKGDITDRTNEVLDFLKYLIHIAKIEVGDEVKQWNYFSESFAAGIILLANNTRMITQGVKPYLDRVTKNLKQGYESIYIIAEENSWEFLNHYETVLSSNDRVLITGKYRVEGIVENDIKRKSRVKIVLLRKVDIFIDDLFKEKITACNITVGNTVEGEILDISEELAVISIMGLDAFIKKNECSWYKIKSCSEILKKGEKRLFIVKKINEGKLSIELSLKFPADNPWMINDLPKIKTKLEVFVYAAQGKELYCKDSLGHEIVLPIIELNWFEPTEKERTELIGQNVNVKIIEIDDNNQRIIGSVRHNVPDPWPIINKKIIPGLDFIGTVSEVTYQFIRVNFGTGLQGILTREHLIELGGIYEDFYNNVVVGQGLEVIVSRVFVHRKKIHLKIKQ